MDMMQKLQLSGLNCQPNNRGWVELPCPYCNRPYMGFRPETRSCFCWYCGKHPAKEVFSRILGITESEVVSLLGKPSKGFKPLEKRGAKGILEKPPTIPLMISHRDYLSKRGFDPEQLVREWALASIGPGHGALSNRIYIPLIYQEQEVSWQTRTVFRTVTPRYLTAGKDQEAVFHKNLLYGWDYALMYGRAVLVEGPADVWKLGPGAVHPFGVQYSLAQLKLLTLLERVYILFDSESKAQRKAKTLEGELSGLGIDAHRIEIQGYKDIGECPLSKARKMMRTLIIEE